MTVLLTGGTGYIGSHTAVNLINGGHKVVIMDNLYNSSADVVDRIEKISGVRPVFYEADVCCKQSLEKVFSENNIDAVIHFAGYKAVGESVEKPLDYYENNILGTVRVLKAMKAHDCKRFIFSSSATVYGENCTPPYTEDQKAGNCANPYGRTKFMIEQIIQDEASADPKLSAVILRYFNPVGAHESGLLSEQPKGVPNNLLPYIVRVAKGQYSHLNLFGSDYPTPDGTCIRDYIHVLDLASGHIAALDYAAAHKGCEIINLGTGKGSSVLEIIDAYEKATGVRIPYVLAPRRAGDLPVAYGSPVKAEKILGWKAVHTIEQACRDSHNAR